MDELPRTKEAVGLCKSRENVKEAGMGTQRFVNIDRETPMLLPPDMREWVKNDDLAHFILEAVEGSELRGARVNERGSGSAQYPPRMMLAVLIYSYATGVFSSRVIEAMTYRHVSVRYLAANHHPDHDTICKFRRENGELIKAVFGQVLKLGGMLKLGQVGTVCVDGTKILAQASKRRTFDAQQLKAEEARLGLEVERMLEQAEKADAQAMSDGTLLPRELQSRQRLKEQVSRAQALLREQLQERAKEREADRQEWKQDPIGECPRPRSSEPGEHDRINLSDPQSALMPLATGGYAQGYNAQLVVSAEPISLIMGTEVSAQTNDRLKLHPMTKVALETACAGITQVVADTGYDHSRQIRMVERDLEVRVFCAPQELKNPEATGSRERGKRLAARKEGKALRQAMAERAQSEQGRRLLRLRSTTVEPVFGLIKSVLGFRRFSLRGLEKVNIEWQLVATAFNCRRLSRYRTTNP